MCSKQDSQISNKNTVQATGKLQINATENVVSDTTEIINRTSQQMWADFYSAKDSVDAMINRSDYTKAKQYLKKAAFHATEVSRKDIAAWQLNNVGYYSIVEFKSITRYDERMQTIEKMRRGDEKTKYIKETRELFKKYLPILTDASKYLEDAYEMDKDFSDNERTQKIYSNLAFIDWVRNFTLND